MKINNVNVITIEIIEAARDIFVIGATKPCGCTATYRCGSHW
jgi:hypothetical protein